MRNNTIPFIPAIFAAALLSGCAATYNPPSKGPVATVQFNYAGVNDGYAYLDEGTPEGNSCGTRKLIKNKKDAVVIPAGKRVWIEQGYSTLGLPNGMYCGFAYSFEPKEGAKYVSIYSYAYRRCEISLFQELESGQRIRDTTIVVAEAPSCLY